MSSSVDQESGSGVEKTPPRCSFCNKAPGDEGTLIEGPMIAGSSHAYICSDCVELCSSILESEKSRRDTEAQAAGDPLGAATREALGEKIDQVLEILSASEREIIKLRHGLADGYTYTPDEVAGRLEIVPGRVEEIEAQAMAKLRSQGSKLAP